MQLTTRGRYGVMAMVELAARAADGTGGCGPVTLADIAASQCISLSYLEQLFGGLRRAGLVAAVRGPGGGYTLARPAGLVTLAEILTAVDEKLQTTRCAPEGPGCLEGSAEKCRTHALWEALGHHLDAFFAGVTLADVLAGDFCAIRPVAREGALA
jgi:Rrf2 family iron-sulfur cluster assembly transcriptional regulator